MKNKSAFMFCMVEGRGDNCVGRVYYKNGSDNELKKYYETQEGTFKEVKEILDDKFNSMEFEVKENRHIGGMDF